jgi:hypothetical protein
MKRGESPPVFDEGVRLVLDEVLDALALGVVTASQMQRGAPLHVDGIRGAAYTHQSEDALVVTLRGGVVQREASYVVLDLEICAVAHQQIETLH